MSDRFLFPRALFAFLVFPGMVALVIPGFMLRPQHVAANSVGFVPLAIGLVLLLLCVRDFYVAGKGTLAPWSPPKRLVVVGLYRYSRNPMYIAVLLMLAGWAIIYASTTLWMYAAVIAVLFEIRVRLFEEPFLERTHSESWEAYRAAVPRWLV